MAEVFDIIGFLKSAVQLGGSDEHLMVGQPPFVRKDGKMLRVAKMDPLNRAELTNALLQVAPPTLLPTFNTQKDIDFMYEIPGVSRFRFNYARGLGNPAVVIRNIPYEVPLIEDLKLPPVLHTFSKFNNGIVVVTGPTGSGKSTTLASIINEINAESAKNIITVEDPIEYVYECKKSRVFQRQVGVDTASFSDAVKYALRQDPDVIFIGEIRDRETMAAALKAAETGHLVFTTLHTNDAVQTINRIVNMFDESNRHLVRKQVSEALRATVAQKLVYSAEHKKRFPAMEIMIVTSTIKDYIQKDNMEEIYSLIDGRASDGMQSLNNSLEDLVKSGCISADEALEASNEPQSLRRVLSGAYSGSREM